MPLLQQLCLVGVELSVVAANVKAAVQVRHLVRRVVGLGLLEKEVVQFRAIVVTTLAVTSRAMINVQTIFGDI